MDFHTLSRRDLQALCKRNKIPANMTNVAMAEALQSLQTVEGLEEVLAHPATETPAKSLAASNRQRPVKEETVNSKLTRTNRGTRKAGEETVAPSAGVKDSTIQQGYSTRRSTRLLEKQMCHLSLKENDDMVDAKAILEKDSQDMQRQFSVDMESSLDLIDETTDETDVSKEATEEPIIVEIPLQSMDTVLENKLPTPEKCIQLENVGHIVEEPNLVDVPVQNMDTKSLQFEPFMKLENDAGDLEKSTNQKEECKDAEVQPMQEDAVDDVNVATSAQDSLSVTMTESDSTEIEKAAFTEDPIQEGVDQLGADNAQNALAPLNTIITVDEHIFGSEDTVVGTEEIGSSDNSPCHTVTEGDDDTRSTELSDDEFDFLSESSESKSEEEDLDSIVSMKISESTVEEVNEVITNQSSCKNSDENQEKLSLQDENMTVVGTATPVEKKSLRQLKKMVKEKKQALQVRQENV